MDDNNKTTQDVAQYTAALEVQNLEIKLEQLQRKWLDIEDDYRQRGKRIETLREEIQQRDATIARLKGRVDQLTTGSDTSQERPVPGSVDAPAEPAPPDSEDLLDPALLLDDAAAAETVVLPPGAHLPEVVEPCHDSSAIDDATTRKLIVVINGNEKFRYPLHKSEITIGRSKRADIHAQSRYTSRLHARIRALKARTVIEDAGSKNGVLVNSQLCDRQTLHDGDIVTIGELQLRFVDLDECNP